jgi:glycosyltransferase involved in cell wall biosynthesis
MKTAIIIRRIGPYHAARLRALAAAGRGPVGVVEIVEADDTYAWDPVTQIEGVERATLFRSEAEAHSISALSSRMFETLERWMPAIVAVPGWADPAALAALAWSRSARRSAIIMSDSTAWDARRVPWREVVKRAVVGMADAALVAGEPHRRYLMALGMPSDRIEIGYDVIDNHHFAAGADCARADAAASRRRLGLPNQYILCVARFVEKKNLLGLLDAYEDYLTIATAALSLTCVSAARPRASWPDA